MLKQVTAVVVGSMFVSASVFAQASVEPAATQQVAATKTAQASNVLPNTYGSINLRRYDKFLYQGKELQNSTPFAQVRLTLGVKLFNEKLDSNLTFFAQKNTDTTQITTPYAPELISELTALSTDHFAIKPYVDMFLPYHGAEANGDLGIVNKVKGDVLTTVGAISLEAYSDVYTTLAGDKTYTSVEQRPEHRGMKFGLRANEDGDYEIAQQDPSLTTAYGTYATLAVSAVEGLSVQAGLEYARRFDPVYKTAPQENDQAEMTGYKANAQTETLFDVSYAFTKALTLSNTTYHYTNGFYEAGYDVSDAKDQRVSAPTGTRLLNRTMLTYTLF